jgi:hypothetical protein
MAHSPFCISQLGRNGRQFTAKASASLEAQNACAAVLYAPRGTNLFE